MDIKSFYKYQEHRGQSGYGASILVKEQTATKYSLLVASQTTPTVFGTQNSFEFDLLNSPVTGKIAGKIALDNKEVNDVLLHRDNVWRFAQLKGKMLDFLYMTPDFVGWHFTGTVTLKPNDASADVLTGTYTIVPISADDDPIFECRSLVEETLCFSEAIPESAKKADSIDVKLVQNDATATYTAFPINSNGRKGSETAVTLDAGTTKLKLASVVGSSGSDGLYGITASATGYAPWTTTIYIEA